jgi:hypothetical protein
VQDDATMRKLLETYFNPMTYIDHHVSVHSTNSGWHGNGLTDKETVWSSDCQWSDRKRDADKHAPNQGDGD